MRNKLIEEILANKDCYAQHKYDLGLIKQKFNIKLKPNTEFRRQRPSKVPIQYWEKLQVVLKQLEKAGVIQQMGSDEGENEMGTEFINPIIIIPKNETLKIVLDARFLNSVTDLTSYYWPLEPLEVLLTRLKGNIFSTSDMASAYHQVPLTDSTQKLCTFVIGDRQWKFKVGLYGLAGLPNFFSRVMTMIFEPLIRRGAALTYIDDILIQANSYSEMLSNIKEFHKLLRKSGLRADPKKTHFFQMRDFHLLSKELKI